MWTVSWIILHSQWQEERAQKGGNIYYRKAHSLSKMDGFLLLRKMSSFFPSSVWPAKKKKAKVSFKVCSLIMRVGVCCPTATYCVDAAASYGPCSTDNSSQTPVRCSLKLGLAQMGPFYQIPPKRQCKILFICPIGYRTLQQFTMGEISIERQFFFQ